MDRVCLDAAEEIEKIALENNISVHDLIEQYKKAYSLTDQDKENTHNIRNKYIITQN